jgi:hypothetical protein
MDILQQWLTTNAPRIFEKKNDYVILNKQTKKNDFPQSLHANSGIVLD